MAAEADNGSGNTSLGRGHSCSITMKFISMLGGMVAGIVSLIIDVFFCKMSQQFLPKSLNLLVKYKLDIDNSSHM